MVYRKYREYKQFGRFNTRRFKTIAKRYMDKEMPPYYVPEALQTMGVEIHDLNTPGFFDKMIKSAYLPNHPMFGTQSIKDHPLYKEQKAYLFEGNRSFGDGIDQACALLNSLKARPLPSEIISDTKIEWPTNIENLVVDSIMAGERYDPTFERLEKRHDPILFWTIKYPMFGASPAKKNNVILENLYRRVQLIASRTNNVIAENRCDYDQAFSSYLPARLFGSDAPFVIRHQPHLLIQSPKPVPAIASKAEVENTIFEKVPDIYPLSPMGDLTRTNIYNDTSLVARSQLGVQKLHINTLIFNKQQNQKYPFTTDELAANAIMFCFGAALAQAHRTGEDINLIEQPIVTKAIQLVDGRIDLVAFQLNTLELDNSEGVKNLVWVDKAQPLYIAKSAYENIEQVEELNMDTFKKFANLLIY